MSETSKEAPGIRATELDPTFKYEVSEQPGGKHIRYCFACGTCSAGCPVRWIDEQYNPRRILRMVLLGMKERVLRSDFIWLCSTCYTCYERCPQGVGIAQIMTVLKNMAARAGYMRPVFGTQIDLIEQFGRLYEIEDFDNRRREQMGLPPVSRTCPEVAEILRVSGIREKVGL